MNQPDGLLEAEAPESSDKVGFFGGLPKELVAPMTQALEAIYEHVVEHGTLPAPASEP